MDRCIGRVKNFSCTQPHHNLEGKMNKYYGKEIIIDALDRRGSYSSDYSQPNGEGDEGKWWWREEDFFCIKPISGLGKVLYG